MKALLIFYLIFYVLAQTCDPPCGNGGVCVGTNTCWCKNPGWSGATCMDLECQNGGTIAANGVCKCPAGWTGMRCTVCTKDSVCTNKCNKDLELMASGDEKYFDCKVLGDIGKLLGNNLTAQIDMDKTGGNIYIQLWYPYEGDRFGSKIGELVWCDLFDCKMTKTDGGNRYDCNTTQCRCTDLCSPTVAAMIKLAKTTAQVDCTDDRLCHFKQHEVPLTADIDCIAGACT